MSDQGKPVHLEPPGPSDIVALMVFQHQIRMMNLIARAASGGDVNELADYMLFTDEAPLPAGQACRVTRKFMALGPRDSRGRSLQDLDLNHRLMRYPCSYMIYSPAFEALPSSVRAAVYQRMWHVLETRSETDRRAVIEILRDTKRDLPEYYAQHSPLRERFLKGLVWFGALLFVSTELLSVFSSVTRTALVLCWSAVALALVFRIVRNPPAVKWRGFDPVVFICIAGSAGILALTAVAAAFSPPNSSDAMAYHMPRVVFWAEQASVRFFPTQYFNQIMLQPFAEYLMLHTYVIAGGDRFICISCSGLRRLRAL